MDVYQWNYFTTFADGVPYDRVFILCNPGDWPEIRDSLSEPQPWDERAHGDPQVHNPACWTVRRLGVYLGALSPPFGAAVVVSRRLSPLGHGSLGASPAVIGPVELGDD